MVGLKLKIFSNSHSHEVNVEKVTGEYKVTIDGQIYKCIFKDNQLFINGELFPIEVEGDLDSGATVKSSNRAMQVKVEQVREIIDVGPIETDHKKAAGGAGSIIAPMPGKVISIKVKVGDEVKLNQVVAVLEAMKMENEIMSEVAGKVKDLKVKPGQAVESDQVLIVVE
ncbi:MAG: Pyruvate carboxylase subunit B [Methanomassiliicoccales archaeon PtaU1.Bin124]|nr:MAG: Pyruvate carboxylase subunit B [Methanomassiliicoccales archaeon PtaU1.Bin124]